MKNYLASALLGLLVTSTAHSQTTVIIGGTTSNGDLEVVGDTFPFQPPGGVDSPDFNLTDSGARSLKIDLTANNAEGRWKGIAQGNDSATGIVVDVEEGSDVIAEAWIYIPAATTFGTSGDGNGVNKISLNLERFPKSEEEPDAFGGTINGWFNRSLDAMPRDEWVQVRSTSQVPAGVTQIRTRAWNITTATTVNEKEAFDNGGDPENKAVPADWIAANYSGFIYMDEVKLTVTLPPPPGIGIEGEVRNGNLESPELGIFGEATINEKNEAYQSLTTEFDHTAPNDGQAYGIDLGADDQNQWRGITPNADVILDVQAGDIVQQECWLMIPSDVVIPEEVTEGLSVTWNFALDSNAFGDTPGTSFNIKTAERDVWHRIYAEMVVPEGTTQVSTTKWYLSTPGPNSGADPENDQGQRGLLEGIIYFDDFVFKAAPVPPVQVIVGPGVNNGDMEATTLNPFNATGGSISTDQNNTVDGSQALEIDLTSNNSNQQWKGLVPAGLNAGLISDRDTVNASVWVYVPAATTFGGPANLNFEMRADPDNTRFDNAEGNTPFTVDLTDAVAVPRDTWVKIEALGLVVPEGSTNIKLGNWNFATVNLLSGGTIYAGDNDPLDGQDGFGLPKATPTDWQTEGYSGVVYIDDILVEVVHPQGPDIQITSTSYEPGVGFTIYYDSNVGPVDLWKNDDGELTEDGYAGAPLEIDLPGGAGQSYTDEFADPSIDPRLFYFLAPAGEDPFNP